MSQVDLKEAQSQLPDLVRRAAQGEEIVIVENHQPRVQLVAIQEPQKKRTPGTAKGLIEIADAFDEPLEDFRDYM